MSYAARVYLKHYIVDALFILVGVAFWLALSVTICTFFDLWGETTVKTWFYLWSGMYVLIMSGYTIVLIWNFFANIQYHQSVSKSKIGSSYERFNKNPKPGQSIDLLKDILFGLDWLSFRDMNEYLSKVSKGTASIKLEDHTWELRDRVFRPTPKILLIRNGAAIANLYIR